MTTLRTPLERSEAQATHVWRAVGYTQRAIADGMGLRYSAVHGQVRNDTEAKRAVGRRACMAVPRWDAT